MKKKIVVIIGGRGIGDLIYHLPLLKSLYKTYGEKIYIISNKINQSKEVFKNEVFYKKIIEFDNYRFGIFKTIKNIFIFKKKINDLKPKYIFLLEEVGEDVLALGVKNILSMEDLTEVMVERGVM